MAQYALLKAPATGSPLLVDSEDRLFHCRGIWNPVEARFNTCFLPFISAIPAAIAVCILVGHVLRRLLVCLRRPRWSEAFVKELPDTFAESCPKAKRLSATLLVALLVASLSGLVLQVVTVVRPTFHWQAVYPTVSWAIASLLIAITRPRTTPVSLLILYCSILTSQLIVLIQSRSMLRLVDLPSYLGILAAISNIVIVLSMPMRDPELPKNDISPAFGPPGSHLRSPEDDLTLWQFMTVTWVSPLITLAKVRPLKDQDVWNLSYECQHRMLHDNFRELQGSVLRRLLVANSIDLVLTSLLGILELLANLSVPVLLQQILRSMEDTRAPKRAAITYTVLTLVVRLIACQADVLSLWFSRRSYERSRGELVTMLYEKALRRKIVVVFVKPSSNGSPEKMPEDAKQAASMGKIMSLMRYDTYEVSQRIWEWQSLITQPLGVILSLVLIWKLIGWPCLIGILTIFVAQVLNALIARVLLRWQRIRRVATDIKLQKITQFVEAIRHLRWYGWQDAWLVNIMDARQKELNLRILTSFWGTMISFVNTFSSGLFPVAAFYAYTVLAGEPLRIDIAFPALQLFSMLENSLRELPGLITVNLNAAVAVERLQDFINEPDVDDAKTPSSTTTRLAFENATFAWPGASKPVLHDLTLGFPTGFTVVYGEVAAGKTALLQALLGELDMHSGDLFRPNEMVGYCAQTPWLQTMSIRENILFSSPYEDTRYKEVLDACALTADMVNFKHGDLSNIGENGVGLSGGQKARVALARAVYSRARILLLDDPLSALDHQTAESIVRRCFGGRLLQDRTAILVTHRTELCHSLAAQMIEISGGRARRMDPRVAFSNSLRLVVSSESATDQNQAATDEEYSTAAEKFMEDEYMARGGVKASVYWEYIKAGKLKWWFVLVSVLALFRFVDVVETWFLKEWGEAYDKPVEQGSLVASFQQTGPLSILSNTSTAMPQVASGPFDRLPSPETNIRPWLIGFFLLAIAQAIVYLISQGIMQVIIYSAGKQMFRDVMTRVSHATFRFYDVTPVGRLMNRLTSDISTIDGNISDQFQRVAKLSIAWVTSVVIIASVTPIFLAFTFALTAGFVLIFLQFLPTSQSLRRLETVSLSPLMTNFGALATDGLPTVRAFHAQEQFQDRVIAVTDTFQKHDHFYWSVQAWLMYRFDALSACSTLILTLLALYTGVSSGLTAFVLTAASQFVVSTHLLCRQYGQLQMDFVSVERIVELLHLDQEPPGTVDPPAWWPSLSGDIVFDNVTIKYAPHLEPSLSNLSFTIKGGSTTAVIGRTGSGKSTLALSLLATVLPSAGRILIDGVDIATVNTQALRHRVTFLAQDPVLFPGTMRQNLDPLSHHTDDDCRAVLAKICGRHAWTLTTKVEPGGRNLSQGQRQLVGLARALLRRSPIVILDEATASIDQDTAGRIQEILREEMKGSTVITIAHRVEAVKGADGCVVLAKGKLVEQRTGI